MSTLYHPVRLAAVKKRRAERSNRGKAELQRRILAGITGADLDEVSADRSHLAAYEEKEGLTPDLTTGWRQDIYERIERAVGAFDATGANIFDMSGIAPMFENTGVDDVEIGDTPLPYPAFYLHFGPDAGLPTPLSGLHLEGAYVRQDPDDAGAPIEVTFVCNHPGHAEAARTPLGETWRKMTTATGTAIHRDRTVGAGIAMTGFAGDPDLQGAAQTVAAAIRMTVNGILYMGTPRAEIEAGWPADAPRDLVRDAADRRFWIAERAREELAAQGYGRVNFVGRRIGARYRAALGDAAGNILPPHWRRGHWRRVVLGQGRLLREWRLFDPTIVNRHLGDPKKGRIYRFDPEDVPPGPPGAGGPR